MILLLTMFAAAIVVYASFCRLTKTSSRTRYSVRFAVWAMAAVAIGVIVAPSLSDWRPDVGHALLMLSAAVYQVVLRRTWQHGAPAWTRRPLA